MIHPLRLPPIIVYGLLVILISSGCKSKKAIQYDGPVPELSDTEVWTSLKDHNYDFEWFACETKISLRTPLESVSGKSYIRMRKDSIIWTSIKKLSVEAVRMLATEESYAAVNRIEGTYQKGSTSETFEKMGLSLDFTDVQQAMFGNVIIPDSASAEIKKKDEHYIISATDNDLQLRYWINAYTKDLDKVLMIDYRKREIEINYGDYRVLDSGEHVPFFRHIIAPFEDQGNAEIVLKVKKIEINIPKKTRFSIPKRYERIY